ncbi:gas vesicle protein GvpJ [Natronosporangium hydrolyticum]|nr:gas vesicle protein GvpJ [Natronosporangium hydrolyticum]
MTVVARGGDYIDRPRSSGLADVIDLILDKGLVIDAFVRVSLLGLELLTIDARIVIASVDTYLRFAEAVDRVVLEPASTTGLPEIVGGGLQGGAKKKAQGVAKGAKESVKDTLGIGGGDDEDEDEGDEEQEPANNQQRKGGSR